LTLPVMCTRFDAGVRSAGRGDVEQRVDLFFAVKRTVPPHEIEAPALKLGCARTVDDPAG
jgi:hypothetical protein